MKDFSQKMNLTNVSEVLGTYNGRDKVLRLLTYLGKLGTGVSSSKDFSEKSQIFSSQISRSRVVLRLLDDIPLLNYVFNYGWGKEVPLQITKTLLPLMKMKKTAIFNRINIF